MEDNSVEMNTGPIKSWMKCTQALIATRLKGIVNGSMLDLQKEMRVNRFIPYDGGQHDNLLMRRSGHLSNSLRPKSAVMQGDVAVGGMLIGKKYGKVLIGKRGSVMTITPKNKQYLAIPLPGALDNHGTPRGAPLDKSVWPHTFIFKGTIFGYLAYQKGAHKGEAKPGLIPLFLLRKSVSVPTKISVEDLCDFAMSRVGEGLAQLKNEIGAK